MAPITALLPSLAALTAPVHRPALAKRSDAPRGVVAAVPIMVIIALLLGLGTCCVRRHLRHSRESPPAGAKPPPRVFRTPARPPPPTLTERLAARPAVWRRDTEAQREENAGGEQLPSFEEATKPEAVRVVAQPPPAYMPRDSEGDRSNVPRDGEGERSAVPVGGPAGSAGAGAAEARESEGHGTTGKPRTAAGAGAA